MTNDDLFSKLGQGLPADDPRSSRGELFDARLLAGLMTLAVAGGRSTNELWAPEDLAMIWRHQLGAPLVFDLGGASPDAEATVTLLCIPHAIKSVADLVSHPAAPLPLLRMLKDFARDQREQPESAYPEPVALALYYVAIALDESRHQCRISRMDEARLREGMKWLAHEPWLDSATRDLGAEAFKAIEKGA